MARRGTSRALGAAAACAGVVLVLGFGCASQHQITRLSPGVYQVECRDSLATCLLQAQDACRAHGYDVLSASEKRNYVEQVPQGYESVKASATVRCREAVPMFGPDPNVPVPVTSASVAASAIPSSPPAPSAVPPPAPVPAAASVAPPGQPAAPAAPPAPAAGVDAGAP